MTGHGPDAGDQFPHAERLGDIEVTRIGAVGAPAAERAQVLVIMELRRSVITGETCARASIMADRTALGPIRGPVARAAGLPPGPSAGLPPSTYQRSGRFRQAPATAAIRLFLRGDRRHDLLGHHNPQPPRRVDPTRRPRPAQADRAGVLRPDRRPRPRPDRRGRLHHQGARRRRVRRPVTVRPRQTGRETLGHDGRIRHPSGSCPGRSQPPRLPVTRSDPGPPGRLRPFTRRHHRAPGRRLRLGHHPRPARRKRPSRPHRRHRSRPVDVGMSNAPTPGRTPSTGSPAATSAAPPSSTTPSSTSPTPSSPYAA
ncbi:hypothetical protein D3C57_144255 [Streptomyces rapamycinicus NRRL 5491]|uniref:Uncharacterized protein n=1 Tax=Streptomyces rapamycinicus (strain ATCC 29253 / DSM 41530 / NRRL 5491 / AYB-994) TaxID=1343740 RepID=A0A3L8QWY1_STRRN|nr:hypothetical protein D3C57_144255 [Streptomyces rapamycinicus NRRL 5491]